MFLLISSSCVLKLSLERDSERYRDEQSHDQINNSPLLPVFNWELLLRISLLISRLVRVRGVGLHDFALNLDDVSG